MAKRNSDNAADSNPSTDQPAPPAADSNPSTDNPPTSPPAAPIAAAAPAEGDKPRKKRPVKPIDVVIRILGVGGIAANKMLADLDEDKQARLVELYQGTGPDKPAEIRRLLVGDNAKPTPAA